MLICHNAITINGDVNNNTNGINVVRKKSDFNNEAILDTVTDEFVRAVLCFGPRARRLLS
jgi:hypothetical protein